MESKSCPNWEICKQPVADVLRYVLDRDTGVHRYMYRPAHSKGSTVSDSASASRCLPAVNRIGASSCASPRSLTRPGGDQDARAKVASTQQLPSGIIVTMSDKRRIDSFAVDFLLFAGLVSLLRFSPPTFPQLTPEFPQMATGAYVIRQVISSVISDPEREKHEQASVRAKAHLERLQREKDRRRGGEDGVSDENGNPRVEDLTLNQYENTVAMDMVAPQDIHVGFECESIKRPLGLILPDRQAPCLTHDAAIGGLDGIIEELKESVIYPLTMPQLYSHGGSLLSAPSGVLLYGPPGCGKTMLAKALAHESGASFINLHISTLLEKWYGDSNKLVRAVFTLARKMQPAIIFIDEIDAVLRMRANSDHEASAMVKAE